MFYDLVINLGSKTLGLVRGEGKIAFSWKTLRFCEHNFNDATAQLNMTLKEYHADTLVFGYPINMDGSVGSSVETVNKFIESFKLQQNNDKLNIVLQDERRTTILQSYFDKINQQ